MDIVSHGLIGALLSLLAKEKNKKPGFFWPVFFSVIADITLIPFYIVLGYEKNRFLWIAQNNDWDGASITHPFLTMSYDITHSLIFFLIIIIPIILFFKIPKIAILAYFLHILIDLPTHTGEWAIKVFYPIKYQFQGFTDAWAWNFEWLLISWVILFGIVFLTKKYKKI